MAEWPRLDSARHGDMSGICPDNFLGDVQAARGVLDERENSVGHESRCAHRCPVTGYLGDLDDAAASLDLDAAPVACGHHLVRANLVARIDDDLHPITTHTSTVAEQSASEAMDPLTSI